LARARKSVTSASVKALSSDSIATACATLPKRADACVPTLREGLSGRTRSAKRCSISVLRRSSASYSASEMVGASCS
jgi:hypothetical protein